MVWVVSGVWHSLVVYFGSQLLFTSDVIFENGRTTGLWVMGTLAATVAIILVNVRMVLEVKTWNWLLAGVLALSVLAYIFFLLIYHASTFFSDDSFYVFYILASSVSSLLAVFGLIAVALVPDYTIQYIYRQYWPEDWQILREKYRSSDLVELKLENFNKRPTSSVAVGNIGFSSSRDLLP